MGGMLIDGQWKRQDEFAGKDGEYKRQESKCRDWITPDGSPGPDGQNAAKAELDRYHLYVSYACPWAHRVLILRELKGLQDTITVSVVHPYMLEDGWHFGTDFDGATGDHLYDKTYLHEIYTMHDGGFTGRVTVPVLWDKKEKRIVNNESSEIIRILNTAFDEIVPNDVDTYPADLREGIDRLNEQIYEPINNGVYKSGFATTQRVYERHVHTLFEALEDIEAHLAQVGPYLVGGVLTEADIRLFTTLVRFDPVYVGHFKCNIKQIREFPNLNQFTQSIAEHPAIQPTTWMTHIKSHYYYSHNTINPTRIVPVGPL